MSSIPTPISLFQIQPLDQPAGLARPGLGFDLGCVGAFILGGGLTMRNSPTSRETPQHRGNQTTCGSRLTGAIKKTNPAESQQRSMRNIRSASHPRSRVGQGWEHLSMYDL